MSTRSSNIPVVTVFAVTTHRQLRAATQGDLNYLRTRTVIRLMGICSFWTYMLELDSVISEVTVAETRSFL